MADNFWRYDAYSNSELGPTSEEEITAWRVMGMPSYKTRNGTVYHVKENYGRMTRYIIYRVHLKTVKMKPTTGIHPRSLEVVTGIAKARNG